MALTTTVHPTTRPVVSREDFARGRFPRPTQQQLLQRQIEDTLFKLTTMPESSDKVLVDLGSSDQHGTVAGRGWYAIQCNQLPLFTHLEELVEKLDDEAKSKLLDRLHPAMSVQERNALKLVIQKCGSFKTGMIPRPLNVRKRDDEQVDGKGALRVAVPPSRVDVEELLSPRMANEEEAAKDQEMAMTHFVREPSAAWKFIVPDQTATKEAPETVSEEPVQTDDGLSFPELSPGEMSTRETQLAAARAERDGTLVVARSPAEARKRRQEIANMLSLAAKKIAAGEGTAADLASPILSPTLKEGLHLIKSASSALRAYTDASPREIVLSPKPDGGRPSVDTLRSSGEVARSEGGLSQPGMPSPRPSISRELAGGQPGRSTPENVSPVLGRPPSQPPAPPAKTTYTLASLPLRDREATNSSPRPRSDPAKSGSPWSASFSTSPRTTPGSSRAVSLPHPAAKPRVSSPLAAEIGRPDSPTLSADCSTLTPSPTLSSLVRPESPTLPFSPSAPALETATRNFYVAPLPLHRRKLSTSTTSSAIIKTPSLTAHQPASSPPPISRGQEWATGASIPAPKRHGSISAARAGIEDRLLREQVASVKKTLPYERSSTASERSSSGSERSSPRVSVAQSPRPSLSVRSQRASVGAVGRIPEVEGEDDDAGGGRQEG